MKLRETLARRAPFEEHVVFENEGQKIAGFLCLPDYRYVPCPAVLLAHGFTGSRNADSRLLTWMARALAHNRIGALAIDFRGSGESEGDFSEMTPETEVSDAKTALDFLEADLRVDGRRLGMVGHSLGGLVAACASGDDKRIRALALWAAVGETAFFQPRFSDSAESRTPEGWDAGGLLVGEVFRDCIMDMNVQNRFGMGHCPVLIAHGTEDQSVPYAQAELFVENANQRARHFKLLPIDGADHCFRRMDWREILLAATLDWFNEHLCPAG
jgi:uncharacterized protein